jgi:hypothetical protein
MLNRKKYNNYQNHKACAINDMRIHTKRLYIHIYIRDKMHYHWYSYQPLVQVQGR